MTRGYAGKQRKFWRFGRRERGQRYVKDRLFRFLFEEDREALLQLYNALNGTDYQDASQLEIVTIESAVYVVMKNDLAFVLAGTLNMYEHQSTYSPNLPVRFLIYLAQEYQTMIEKARVSFYGTGLIELPAPKRVVFYNGQKGVPERQILRLSDAFTDKRQESDVELTAHMYNINYGHNRELLEKCRKLGEYSIFVNVLREFTVGSANKKEAFSEAVDYCIENGILEDVLRRNRSRVLGSILEEFDVEKYERTLRWEGREEGREEGIRCAVEVLQEAGQTRMFVMNKLAEKYALSQTEAKEKTEQYWK